MPDLEVIETDDGSCTIYSSKLDEIYHSRRGAKAEAEHVFIRHGLELINTTVPNILEIGFGTGRNLLLTKQHFEGLTNAFKYCGLEPFPLERDLIIRCLESELEQSGLAHWFDKVLLGGNEHCQILKEQLLDHHGSNYDLIYFDAFSPATQPEMWEIPVFEHCLNALVPGGALVTYCAKGRVRRNMLSAGFQIEKLPGPPGKREMLRALRPI